MTPRLDIPGPILFLIVVCAVIAAAAMTTELIRCIIHYFEKRRPKPKSRSHAYCTARNCYRTYTHECPRTNCPVRNVR